ncbi:MAG: DMT family transporter, partial [Muribaculaceae bacterium]|nr:DMT family transporter [Muribaculaceae bacterium]
MDKNRLKGHGAMLGAELLWGVSAPLGKAILAAGMSPLMLTNCRMVGAALLFWIVSLFTRREEVGHRDLLAMFFASLCGVVVNQCCFVWGLSLTSPVNASIITTALPIVTMVLAAVVLHEPVTRLKVGGVFLGAIGALVLIIGSASAGPGEGNMWGDLLVICALLSFSCYLLFFKGLIGRYSPVTLMKWMFTYSAICVIPFTYSDWIAMDWVAAPGVVTWGALAFVVGPTFLSYFLLPLGQRFLRPTVTA